MKKMFFGRKGLVLSMVAKLFLLLLAILAGYWAYQILASGLGGLDKDVEAVVRGGDFDGDGLANYIDPCPCGPNNVKQEINGTSYCITSYDKQTCVDVAGFKYEESTNRCIYLKDECMDYIRRVVSANKNE